MREQLAVCEIDDDRAEESDGGGDAENIPQQHAFARVKFLGVGNVNVLAHFCSFFGSAWSFFCSASGRSASFAPVAVCSART